MMLTNTVNNDFVNRLEATVDTHFLQTSCETSFIGPNHVQLDLAVVLGCDLQELTITRVLIQLVSDALDLVVGQFEVFPQMSTYSYFCEFPPGTAADVPSLSNASVSETTVNCAFSSERLAALAAVILTVVPGSRLK